MKTSQLELIITHSPKENSPSQFEFFSKFYFMRETYNDIKVNSRDLYLWFNNVFHLKALFFSSIT